MSGKNADTAYPIHELLADRWSPRAFADRPVDAADLARLFEAARWAASCYNAQPWHFVFAHREQTEAFEKLSSCVMDGNRWATEAAVLILTVVRTRFSHNDKPNRHAGHDLGLAVGNLSVQAQALGLSLHQMAGFHADRAREQFAIDEPYEPMTMIALGYRGDADQLDGALREREAAPRERRPQSEFVFEGEWRG